MHKNLTLREQEILDLLLDSVSPKDIAYKLNISYSTVDYHRNKLYRKLGVQTIQELHAKYGAAEQSVPENYSVKEEQSKKNPERKNKKLILLVSSGTLNLFFIILLTWYFITASSESDIYPMRIFPEYKEWEAYTNAAYESLKVNSAASFQIEYETIQGQKKEVLTIYTNIADSRVDWINAGAITTDNILIRRLQKASGIRFNVIGEGEPGWEVQFWTDHEERISYDYPIYTEKNQVIIMDIPLSLFNQTGWDVQFPLSNNDNKKHISHFVIHRNTNHNRPVSGESTIKIYDFMIY